MGFIIPNSQTNLEPVGFIRGGDFINIRTVPKNRLMELEEKSFTAKELRLHLPANS